MKFFTDSFEDRVLVAEDTDGDRLQIIISNDGSGTVKVNQCIMALRRKQFRKIAKRILKETEK